MKQCPKCGVMFNSRETVWHLDCDEYMVELKHAQDFLERQGFGTNLVHTSINMERVLNLLVAYKQIENKYK